MAKLPANMAMDINDDIIRERFTSSTRSISKSTLVSSTISSILYHQRMEINNNLSNKDLEKLIDKSQLSYASTVGNENNVRKAADNGPNSDKENLALKKAPEPCGKEKVSTVEYTNLETSENMLNIQLPYDINQALDPESWDGNFNPILLYESIEYLRSDVKNIIESLCCIQKYIINKKIESGKANNVKYLRGMGKIAWGFISSLYKSG